MAKSPSTSAPTDFEWETYARWAIGPVGTRRQFWIAKEAKEIHFQSTGRYDAWPTKEDYAEAALRIPEATV